MRTSKCIFCANNFKPNPLDDFDEQRICFSCKVNRGMISLFMEFMKTKSEGAKKSNKYWAEQLRGLDI